MSPRKILQNFIEYTGIFIMFCGAALLLIMLTPFMIMGLILFSPFGLFEWATKEHYCNKKRYDHPIGYLMDKLFPEEEDKSSEQ